MSYLSELGDKVYKQTTGGWLGRKANDIMGDDYQKHLINATIGGGPIAGFGTDYQQGEADNGNGWKRVGENAGKSAAILAAIFGGSALGGGGEGAGAGGTGIGNGSGIGAENGGLMIDQGATTGAGFDWQAMAQQFMGQGGLGQMMGGGEGGQGGQTSAQMMQQQEQRRLIEALAEQKQAEMMRQMQQRQLQPMVTYGPAA